MEPVPIQIGPPLNLGPGPIQTGPPQHLGPGLTQVPFLSWYGRGQKFHSSAGNYE